MVLKARCIRFYEFGSPSDVLKVENKMVDWPVNGEILVRMTQSPINPSDLLPIRGAYAHRISLPAIPGYEGVGVVEDVGPAVSKALIGQRVLPLRGEGTWQEYVKTAADWAVPVPDSIEDHIAAQLYINPLTAWIICTEVLKMAENDVLVVNTCGSSIGRILIQLSKILGFQLIAVTRNNAYTEELLSLGATHVINESEVSLKEAVMEITHGSGVNAAIDSVGGQSGTELAFCVQPNGVFITIGLLSGVPLDWGEISKKTRLNAMMFHLRHWNQKASLQTWHDAFEQLIELINQNKLVLMKPAAYYYFEAVKEAVRVAESAGKNKGKILLTY